MAPVSVSAMDIELQLETMIGAAIGPEGIVCW
jgi:hypothetical protein